MPHVIFGCVVVLGHRFVCDSTRPDANLTIYTFWRCKYALLYLSEQNIQFSVALKYSQILMTMLALDRK